MFKPHRAIVVGGGIGGPAVSLFLQRAGIEPQIFESHPEPAVIGGGFQIAPNGMRVLAALGLAERVAQAGAPSGAFCFRNHSGRVIGRVDLRRSGLAVTIARVAFQRILLGELTRRGLSIAYGKKLSGIEHHGGEVAAHFEDGTTATGDMILGTDGVSSRTRALILPEQARAQYTGVLGVGGFVTDPQPPADARDAHQLNFMIGPRLQFGYANLCARAPQWGWWCHLPQETELSRRELQALTTGTMRERVLSAFQGWTEPVERFVRATDHIVCTAIYDVPPLPTWHIGRVMLLGDAAHAMSPAGGQGASLALEDAMVLGQRLADRSRPIEQVFVDVDALLRGRAERIVAQARQNDKRQLKEVGAFGQWMRDRLFPVFAPLVARQLERQYAALWPTAGAAGLA